MCIHTYIKNSLKNIQKNGLETLSDCGKDRHDWQWTKGLCGLWNLHCEEEPSMTCAHTQTNRGMFWSRVLGHWTKDYLSAAGDLRVPRETPERRGRPQSAAGDPRALRETQGTTGDPRALQETPERCRRPQSTVGHPLEEMHGVSS